MADKKQNLMKYGEIISKCWEDEAYKKRFIEDPESVMAEAGMDIEEGVTYKVIKQPKLVRYIVIPHENVKEPAQSGGKKGRDYPRGRGGSHHSKHRGYPLSDSPGFAEDADEGGAFHGGGRRRSGRPGGRLGCGSYDGVCCSYSSRYHNGSILRMPNIHLRNDRTDCLGRSSDLIIPS